LNRLDTKSYPSTFFQKEKDLIMEQPFNYMEEWHPPSGQGYSRYASATLVRSADRRHWVSDDHKWVMNDFGYLIYVK
jgi:hypothetical protein